jgi:hypothetical protein
MKGMENMSPTRSTADERPRSPPSPSLYARNRSLSSLEINIRRLSSIGEEELSENHDLEEAALDFSQGKFKVISQSLESIKSAQSFESNRTKKVELAFQTHLTGSLESIGSRDTQGEKNSQMSEFDFVPLRDLPTLDEQIAPAEDVEILEKQIALGQEDKAEDGEKRLSLQLKVEGFSLSGSGILHGESPTVYSIGSSSQDSSHSTSAILVQNNLNLGREVQELEETLSTLSQLGYGVRDGFKQNYLSFKHLFDREGFKREVLDLSQQGSCYWIMRELCSSPFKVIGSVVSIAAALSLLSISPILLASTGLLKIFGIKKNGFTNTKLLSKGALRILLASIYGALILPRLAHGFKKHDVSLAHASLERSEEHSKISYNYFIYWVLGGGRDDSTPADNPIKRTTHHWVRLVGMPCRIDKKKVFWVQNEANSSLSRAESLPNVKNPTLSNKNVLESATGSPDRQRHHRSRGRSQGSIIASISVALNAEVRLQGV